MDSTDATNVQIERTISVDESEATVIAVITKPSLHGGNGKYVTDSTSLLCAT